MESGGGAGGRAADVVARRGRTERRSSRAIKPALCYHKDIDGHKNVAALERGESRRRYIGSPLVLAPPDKAGAIIGTTVQFSNDRVPAMAAASRETERPSPPPLPPPPLRVMYFL